MMSCRSVPAPWCDLLMCQQLSLGRPECPASCQDSLDKSNAMKDPPQTELEPTDLGFQAAQLKHKKLTTSNNLIAFCHTKPKTIQHTVYFVDAVSPTNYEPSILNAIFHTLRFVWKVMGQLKIL